MVIGIIALLISILLPALRKARMAAQGAQCLSNLRQISMACLMWTNDNNGWMIGRSGGSPCFYPARSATSNGGNGCQPSKSAPGDNASKPYTHIASWIDWQAKLDPITGAANSMDDENITYSATAPYLGTPEIISTQGGNPNSWTINTTSKLNDVFRCPGDNLYSRPSMTTNVYRYSYAMNDFVVNNLELPADANYAGPTISVVNTATASSRNGFIFNGKLSSIRNPGSVTFIYCQDENNIDDACFQPKPWSFAKNVKCDMVSGRHSTKSTSASNLNTGTVINTDTFGNVSFVDGHAELMDRKDSLRQRFTSSPYPDPPGF